MEKPIFILGLNLGHLATAALMKDGQIIACVSEERFTRVKNQSGFPKNAVKFCLKFAGIKDQVLDFVAVSDYSANPVFLKNPPKDPILNSSFFDWLFSLEMKLELKFPSLRDFTYKAYRLYSRLRRGNTQSKRIKSLQGFLKLPKERFIFVDHHTCHGWAALGASGFLKKFDKVLVFTADGVGDDTSATLSIYEGGKLKRLFTNPSQNSLGFFYLHITEVLGFKPMEDEYKVMSLAAYSPNILTEKVYKTLKKFISLDKKRLIWQFKVNEVLIKKALPKILKFYRFDAIASAAQKILEECLLFWIEKNAVKLNCANLVFGGGVFANVKANLKIASLKNIKNCFFGFPPGDESNALGAAYFAYSNLKKERNLQDYKLVNHLYLGPEFAQEAIEKAIKNSQLIKFCNIKKSKDINLEIAKLVVENKVVARFAGRMEFGARALGNRSILAHPQKKELIEFINNLIKSRDFWMPFAPTILRERAKDYLILHHADSTFMNIAFETTRKGQVELAAAIHPYDKTARAQILDKEINPDYYQIIKEFENITGIGAVLNTSFNLHGEPIVCTPQDALRVFLVSKLKYLALENWLIEKAI